MPLKHFNNVFGRITAATAAALVITATLFWIMQAAIERKKLEISDPKPITLVDYVRIERDEDPQIKQLVKPDKPEPVVKTPPPPALAASGGAATQMSLDNTPPAISLKDIGDTTRIDGDPLPIFTVAPEYPQRPLSQGIEGWVVVEFLIDELGRVQDARVIDAQPQRVFDRAALKAVERYKYKPKVLHGKAMPVHGVRQRIVFDLS